ncbi:MAG: hypothetical protein WCT05_01025 [Lentisphaeria bacterium]
MLAKVLLILMTIAFCIPGVQGAEIEILEINNDNAFDQVVNYWCANTGMMQHRPGGSISKFAEGRSGSSMKISNTEQSYSALFSQSLIPVEGNEDIFKLSFYVKGNGKFSVGFYTYSAKKTFVNTYFEPATQLAAEDWVCKSYTIPEIKIKGDIAFVRIAIEVQPGLAELYFDDFSGSKESILPPLASQP